MRRLTIAGLLATLATLALAAVASASTWSTGVGPGTSFWF